jgi:hypothetical protein
LAIVYLFASVVEGTRLSLKIAHFPDIVAVRYLEEKYIWVSDKLQVCGCFWRLLVQLRDAEKKLAQKDHLPKYLGVYLDKVDGRNFIISIILYYTLSIHSTKYELKLYCRQTDSSITINYCNILREWFFLAIE